MCSQFFHIFIRKFLWSFLIQTNLRFQFYLMTDGEFFCAFLLYMLLANTHTMHHCSLLSPDFALYCILGTFSMISLLVWKQGFFQQRLDIVEKPIYILKTLFKFKSIKIYITTIKRKTRISNNWFWWVLGAGYKKFLI